MKKILVPTDFSKNAEHALQIAAAIANKTKTKLEILHTNTAMAYAAPLPEYSAADQFDMTDYYTMAAEQLYGIKKELSAQYPELEIETRVEEGFLYSSIRRTASEDDADLIVMGTKGASGATEFLVGSNTEKVIRTSTCPVLSVPELSDVIFEPKTVVLPTTLKADQTKAFKAIAEWQQFFPLEVKILYLNNPAGLDDDKEIGQFADQIAKETGLKNYNLFASSNTFNEEAAIIEFAREENADLIVMGTHQRRGLSHLLFGSLTEDTVNHSPIPVLSVPLT